MLGVHFWQNWVTHAKNDCAKIFKALHLLEIFAPHLMTVDAHGLLLPSSSSSSFHPIISCLRRGRRGQNLPPSPTPLLSVRVKGSGSGGRIRFFVLLPPRSLKGGENEEAVKEGDKKVVLLSFPLSFSAISSRRGIEQRRGKNLNFKQGKKGPVASGEFCQFL